MSFAKNSISGQCCALVFREVGLRFPRPRQCSRKVQVTRTVDGHTLGFCKLHDPVAVSARDAAREAKWQAQSDAKREVWKRLSDLRLACEGMTNPVSEVATLKRKAAAADALASELQYVLNDASKYPQLAICEHQSDRLNRAMNGWRKALKGQS